MSVLGASHYTPDQISALVDRLEPEKYDGIEKDEMFVAEMNGRIAGFGHASGDEILAMFVDPDHARQGIGRLLLGEGLRRVESKLVRLEAALNAVDFYVKCGFRETGRRTIVRRGVEIEIAGMVFDR